MSTPAVNEATRVRRELVPGEAASQTRRELRSAGPTVAVSVVIRTLNEARYLGRLLDSIWNQSIASETEIVLVDSGSSDATLAIAEERGCRIVRIGRHEFSFGRALNVGCQASQGDFLVFTSGHCVPHHEHWLERLIDPLKSDDVGVAYGRQTSGEGSKFSEHCLFEKYFPAGEASQGPAFCNNANAAVRRELWEVLRYDEELTGLEDIHFSKRAIDRGFRVRYVPEAAVYHYHHETWRQVERRYEREAIALQRILPELRLSAGEAIRYAMAGIFGDLRRAKSAGKLADSWREIVAFRACQYYGSWRGGRAHAALTREEKEKYFYPH